MFNCGFVAEYLKKTFGCAEIDSLWYHKLSEWFQWYRGSVRGFHDVVLNNGLTSTRRELSRLNMAKKVAEDWADMLLNERTYLVIGDKATSVFVQGEDGNGGVFAENDFRETVNRLMEKTFALGTGAFTLRVDGVGLDKKGNIVDAENAKIRIDSISAPGIFPISWQGDRITEVCFASEINACDGRYLYLQIHMLEENEYVIYGKYFKLTSGGYKEVQLPKGIASTVRTGSDIPWFTVFRPNSVNNIFPDLPFGLPVFADCTDILKGIDLCYDSLNMEFRLGRKMVFLRKDLLARDGAGNLFAPQDVNKQLFMYVGDKAVDGDMLPKEFNPSLRVNEHIDALNEQLRCLSVKCGLGEHYYRFGGSGVKTATQVVSENSSLFRTVRKHEISVEKSLIAFTRSLLNVAKTVLGVECDPDTSISVCFDDSIIEDKASEQSRDLELIKNGVMLPWEFRTKYYGEDEATAKCILSGASLTE